MERVLRGVQTAEDPFEFVLSDESVDRMGDVIEAKGWQLANFKKNPIALFNHDSDSVIGQWKNIRIDGARLMATLEMAAAGTSALVDTVRNLIAQRILRAVSVGFKPVEFVPIEGSKSGGYRFTKHELLEASVVSIPANPNALSLSKSLDIPADLMPRLMAKPGLPSGVKQVVTITGKHADSSSRTGIQKMSLADQITARQVDLVSLRDRQTALSKKVETGDDLDETEQAEFDEIDTSISKAELTLTNLRKAETNLAARTAPAPSAPSVVQARNLSGRRSGRPSDIIIRMATVHALAHITREPLGSILERRYGSDDEFQAFMKAAVNPARTDVAGWAAELVETAVDDFLAELQPVSVFAALRQYGRAHTFDRAGQIRIPRRNTGTPDLRGSFVGEGGAIPVRRTTFASILLTPKKLGVITTFTRELANHSTPAIEGILREGIIEDTAMAVDIALLDAVAGTVIRPAGLLNGVVAIPGSAAGGLEAMKADIMAAIGPFVAANAANGLVWLINPSNTLLLNMVTNAVGTYVFRGEVAQNTLAGYPMIVSTHVPVGSLILVRASDFSSAAGNPEFDVSDTAVVHEDDGGYPADQAIPAAGPPLPLVDAAGVAAKPVRSLWQTATMGIRMIQDMDWAMVRAGMVAAVTGVDWGEAP